MPLAMSRTSREDSADRGACASHFSNIDLNRGGRIAMNQTVGSLALMDAVWPGKEDGRLLRNLSLIVAGSLLLTVAARIQVPMWPVPMTMQPLAVMLIGMAFGWRLAGLTVSAYLVQGLVGLPVFAKGAGVAYFAGPTGGYLIGFLIAAMVLGWLAERGWDRSTVRTFVAMVIGSAVIYLFGVLWLSTLIGFEKALTAGVAPFLVGDLVKALAATAIMPSAWKWLRHSR